MITQEMINKINELIILQDKIFNLDLDNIIAVKAYFCESDNNFISSHIQQISHYFYIATIIRPKLFGLQLDLFIYLMSQCNQEGHFSLLPSAYLDLVFSPPPSKSDGTIKNGPISFMRKLLENSIIMIDDVITRVETFMEKYPKYGNCFLLFFCWFIPEIESNNTNLYSKVLSMFDSKQLLMFPYYIVNFFKKIEEIRKDDWKLFYFLADNHYFPGSIEYDIAADDVNGLHDKLIHDCSIDINENRIDCSIFETFNILQNQPTFLQFSIAHNATNCTKYLLLHNARTEEHQYQRYPTSHFSVASENIEMLHYLEQEKCNFCGTLNVAAFYHRGKIFDWLHNSMFQNLNDADYDNGPFLFSCINTENYHILLNYICDKDVNINKRDRTKKTLLFESARTNHSDIVELLLSHTQIDVNLKAVLK